MDANDEAAINELADDLSDAIIAQLSEDVIGLRAEVERLTAENAELRVKHNRLRDTIRSSRSDHIALAAEYEAGGNTRGAMQLRAVGNMLGVILQGGTPTTVCPPTQASVAVFEHDGEAD